MVSAIVLVNTDVQTPKTVLQGLKQLDGVEEVHPLYGAYDILVRVRGDSINDIRDITQLGIRKVSGVANSLTLLIVGGQDVSGGRGFGEGSNVFVGSFAVNEALTP